MHAAAAGELPDEPTVDGAADQLAGFGAGLRALDVIQDPAEFGAGKVGCQGQTGLLLDSGGVTGFFQAAADAVGAGVLPDDGIADGQAGTAVPDDCGLALIGDAYGCDLSGPDITFGEGGTDHRLSALPDFKGIVFDPAAAREDLFVFLLFKADDGARLIKEHETGAGRT